MEFQSHPPRACAVALRARWPDGGRGRPRHELHSMVGSCLIWFSCSWLELAGRSAFPTQSQLCFLFGPELFRPKFWSRMSSATPDTTVSLASLSETITFCCSSRVRFWLSLNLASRLVTVISNPTML